MSTKQSFKIAGVDGCKGGWLVAIVEVKGKRHSFELTCMPPPITNFSDVLWATKGCKVVCIDIPIGLSDRDRRRCDQKAKEILGNRQCCVFFAPIRPILSYKRYPAANRTSRCLSGHGLSIQSFNIMDKIHQVDSVMTPNKQKRFREVHPEVCFWALNHGQPMQRKKTTDAGRKDRMRVLAPIFQNLRGIVTKDNRAKGVKVDDILDALVAAYTAGQVVLDNYSTLPARPQRDGKGLRMEILCPAACDPKFGVLKPPHLSC